MIHKHELIFNWCTATKQGLVSPEFFKVVHRQFGWESTSKANPSLVLVGAQNLCGNWNNKLWGKERVWEDVGINFSCLCYVKIRRRLHIIRTVRFLCTTGSFGGLMPSQDQFRPSLGWAEMQRLNWCFLLKPNSFARPGNRISQPFPSTRSKAYVSRSDLLFSFSD